ncbi:hypothetical protein RI129_003597 [Pyrocoelia pectoralis]|uniref:Uncharacterized protein n=1 Tax=Pyrocoelia pectoralis TaxID=417401 RepID=A0AAN7VII6_9COLE
MAEKKLKKYNGKEEGCNIDQDEQSETLSRKLSRSPSFPYTLPDDIDVVWNWYSPTSKPSKPQYFKPKVKVQQSPKLLVKRHPSHEQVTAFNKLVEELKTLTNPNTVQENTDTSHDDDNKDYLNAFDDSLDADLISISQMVEQSVSQNTHTDKQTIASKHPKPTETVIANDSFDCILASIKDEDLNLENGKNTTKLITTIKDNSPVKCSAEEIEQKRLQALARREAKKMQDNIERNRQEALKRLALTKKRKILQ